jgi:hypothetical protein
MTHGWKRREMHHKILVGKSEGEKPHKRQTRRLEDNIKTGLIEIENAGVAGLNWLRTINSGGLL